MAPGLTGIVGGRPTVYPLIRLFSFLIDKTACTLQIDMAGEQYPCALPAHTTRQPRSANPEQPPKPRAAPTPAWRWSNWRWRAPATRATTATSA
jgi:hypothetical protein